MTPELVTVLKNLHGASVQTVAGALILLELVKADRAGAPHNLRTLADAVDVPYTSVSRIAYDLSQRGFLRIDRSKTDRRTVHIRVNAVKCNKVMSAGAAA